nr:hypothetical protein [Tanacetum cinerariifolium]
MPYLKFIKIIINYFLSQHKSIPKRQGSYVNTIKGGVLGRLKFVSKGEDYQVYRLDTMLTDEIKRSAAYQTFISLSTGLIPSNKSKGKGSKGKKATLTPKNKSSITVDSNIIPEPGVAFELGKSISKTKAKIAKEARRVHETYKHLAKEAMRVHETHERLVTKKSTSVEESNESNGEHANMPTGRRRPTDVVFRDTSNASKKKSLDHKEARIIQQQPTSSSIEAGITLEVSDDPNGSFVSNVVAEIDWGSIDNNISLIGTFQENADTEINSLLDIQIQQEIHTVPSAPLLDVRVSVILEQPTPPTLTPLPTPPIISEALPITTTEPNLLLAVIQRLDDLERKFDAWTKVDHSEAVEASV